MEKEEIDRICEIISDEVATWVNMTAMTLSEELIVETVEKIIINSLRRDLKD